MDQLKQLQCKIDIIRSLTKSESDEKWRKIVDALNSCIVLERERAIVAVNAPHQRWYRARERIVLPD